MAATILSKSTECSVLPFRHPGTYAGRTNGTVVRLAPQPRAGSSATSSFVNPIVTMPRKHSAPIPFRHPGTYATRPPLSAPESMARPSKDVSYTFGATTVQKLPKRTGTSVAPTLESTAQSPEAHAPVPVRPRFYNRTRSAYLGTSSVIIIPTARTPVVAVRAVRTDKAVPELAHLPAAAPPSHDSLHASIALRRTQSTGSCMQRGTAYEEETEDETAPLLRAHRPIASESPAFGLMCIRYGGAPPSKTGSDCRSPPESKLSRGRPISGYFYSVDAEDADLEEMPEVREALHVNARMCAVGYRYERALEVVA
ncbi:hypothetical protein MSAN_02000400 [Mycena sanguinolenta]|uniref:Uncharacterized protein n=1 Tax=Mycena sanguinolenta TaxID=230812 RepID=A0A8H6XJQ4_9AGAR|nr:hypothetical protein MSAN_02000400 [Mycena sanguinolenta]